MAVSLDLVIAPYEAIGGTDMKRVSQYDIYLLGTVRSLSHIKIDDQIAAHRNAIILSYITLDHFCENEELSSLLPNSIKQAKDLRTNVIMLDTEMSGQGLTGGVVNEGLHQMLSHLMIAFETTLKHEINNLPTYVIESIGLYSTDALIGRADEAFPPGVRRLIPANVMDDFKKSGSCLAFDLFTASGFHAFRSLDAMIRHYFAHFAPDVTPPKFRDWGSFVRELRKLVSNQMVSKPNERTIELIDKIRSEDRNPLVHPDENLDKDEALTAFDLCKNAITFMAMDIKNAQ